MAGFGIRAETSGCIIRQVDKPTPSNLAQAVTRVARFKTRMEHRLSWLSFVIGFVTSSRQVPGLYLENHSTAATFLILANWLFSIIQ
jgi:hypothetical protein